MAQGEEYLGTVVRRNPVPLLLALALAGSGLRAAAAEPPAFVYVGAYTHWEELPNHRNPRLGGAAEPRDLLLPLRPGRREP